MAYSHKAFTLTFLSGASISSAFETIGWSNLSVEVPTWAAMGAVQANVYLQVCDTATGTFRDLYDMGSYSAASGIRPWEVPQTAGDYVAICRAWVGYNYAKVRLSTAATGAINLRVHNHQQTF